MIDFFLALTLLIGLVIVTMLFWVLSSPKPKYKPYDTVFVRDLLTQEIWEGKVVSHRNLDILHYYIVEVNGRPLKEYAESQLYKR